MLFSLLKHYLDTDTALKVSQSVYCFTISIISHGVKNYFPRLWGMGISDAIFPTLFLLRTISSVTVVGCLNLFLYWDQEYMHPKNQINMYL